MELLELSAAILLGRRDEVDRTVVERSGVSSPGLKDRVPLEHEETTRADGETFQIAEFGPVKFAPHCTGQGLLNAELKKLI